MAAATVPSVKLSSGHEMPVLGLGVWRAEKGKLASLVKDAIDVGYRHFDCAADYQNEDEVGEALAEVLKAGKVKREELFITTKLWNSDHGHVREACKASLAKLQLDYLDLFLVHFPIASRHTGVGTTDSVKADDGMLDVDLSVPLHKVWAEVEKLVAEGLVRSIGISNYDVYLTRDALAYATIKPAVNQIETHPYFQRDSLVRFCLKFGVSVTAHTPLGGGAANEELFKSTSPLADSVIAALAEKYKKSPAQVILRWGVQRNTVVIPKSNRPERLTENLSIFDFEISEEDMGAIHALDRRARSNNPAPFWGIDLYA